MSFGLLLAGLAWGISTFVNPTPRVNAQATTTEEVVCAMDMYSCPDGSQVGRKPPSCDFALCVNATTTPGGDYFKG